MKIRKVVINHKTTKFESNSQRERISTAISTPLLSITKLQNLKAIHNTTTLIVEDSLVVINHKTTKFESNSQRSYITAIMKARCYQSQNYKI